MKKFDSIERLAAEALDRHMLRAEGEGRWFCGRPGTGFYHFRVVTAPGHVFLCGDLGTAILACSERDSLSWLKRAIGSADYLLGKSQHAHRDRWGWMPQDMWHYFALKRFCELLDA